MGTFFGTHGKNIFTLNRLIPFERTVNDEELADESVEEDGLVVVGPGCSKLVIW